MSQRIDKSWLVFLSIENFEHDRCVDLFSRPDGTHGFEEFRRDAEDRGAWTPVQYYSGRRPHSRLQSNRWRGWQKQSGSVPRHKDCCCELQTEKRGSVSEKLRLS